MLFFLSISHTLLIQECEEVDVEDGQDWPVITSEQTSVKSFISNISIKSIFSALSVRIHQRLTLIKELIILTVKVKLVNFQVQTINRYCQLRQEYVIILDVFWTTR